jgi:hypothetical protein
MRQAGDKKVYIDDDDGSSGSLFGTPPGATRGPSVQSNSYTDGDDDFGLGQWLLLQVTV